MCQKINFNPIIRKPYMSKAELTCFMFVGCMAGQLAEIAEPLKLGECEFVSR